MVDLNDLRIFESVATRRSFSAAARALGIPNSSVSRGVKRLETALAARLVQRTTREVSLTDAGNALHARCSDLLERVDEAIDFVASFAAKPRGLLRVNVPIGVGYNLLPNLLPKFIRDHPDIDVALELTSRVVDLVAEGVDVTIRMGALPDSRLIARQLGRVQRLLCAAPAYLERQGTPSALSELHDHATIDMLGLDGKPRQWTFVNYQAETVKVAIRPRMTVNDPGAIHRFVLEGAGIGCIPDRLCEPDMMAGRLVRLFEDWRMPPIQMSAVFPSSRELSPAVRAFIDLLAASAESGQLAFLSREPN